MEEEDEEDSPMKSQQRQQRQIRYLKEKATKKIAKDAQNKRQQNQMRKRPRQLPVQVNGETMMLNVLDDGWQDNVPKVVPDMKADALLATMVHLSEGSLTAIEFATNYV